MIYFLASDVCEKVGIRNSTDVFKSNNLINGRDYIKFAPKTNPKAFSKLVDLGYTSRTAQGIHLLTIQGVFEVLFKSKNPEARIIKDKLLNVSGYEIYESVAYQMVSKLVWQMSESKRDKFFSEESFALGFIKNAIGGDAMNNEVVKSVNLIRTFHATNVSNEFSFPEMDLSMLISEFNGFCLV